MHVYRYRTYYLDFFPPPASERSLELKKINPPLNSFRTVTQPHSLLATRTTWTTQITCLASLYSRTILHCTYMYLLYRDISRVHFDGVRATGAHAGLG